MNRLLIRPKDALSRFPSPQPSPCGRGGEIGTRALLALGLMACSAPVWAEGAPRAALGGMVQVTLGLLLVLAVMMGIVWLMRRLGLARSKGQAGIRVVTGIGLGGRERVVVLEVADQWLVVGVAPGSINMLHVLPRQPEVTASPEGAANNKPFAQLMAEKFQGMRGG